MKIITTIYWITTGILALMMSFSAYSYLTQEAVQQGFHHLGFPDYFRIELAIAKMIGVVVLLAPVAARVKEWAYAGFGITFISAFIAHIASGDPIAARIMPVLFFVLLAASYITYHRRQSATGHALHDNWQAIL